MAKKVIKVGSITTGKDGKSMYIKVDGDVTLSKGQYLNLENEKTQLAKLDYAVAQGWVKESEHAKRAAQISSYWNDPIPTKDGKEFVRSKNIKYNVTTTVEE